MLNLRSEKSGRGFSLIIVLIISVIGMSLLGATVYMLGAFSGYSRASISHNTEYNVMQQAIEQGRGMLRDRMNNTDPPPRWTDKANATPRIGSVDMLLIPDGRVIDRRLGAVELGGRPGRLVVRIFDMQYDPALVDKDEAMIAELPGSFILSAQEEWVNEETSAPIMEDVVFTGTANNAGVYLIRATLEFDVDGDGAVDTIKGIDSAVVQSNNT